ncbi:MAG: DUF3782 domain-containing protein [Thermodesulfobacteriaceae bacterium]|nr:DUF3782 domain-containing protein [Thermodesulfobacteriaceae bacterium]
MKIGSNSSKKRTLITKQALRKIIVEKLPKLLEEEPQLRDFLASFLKHHFADKEETKDEIKALLEEIKLLRIESEKKFEEHSKVLREYSQRFEEQNKILQEQNKRLEEQNRRLEEHSKRLDEHSKILQEQNKRLEEQNKRFEEQSKRLEEQNKRLEEHSKILQEHSKRLEEQSKRLEEVSKELAELFKEFQRQRKKHEIHITALGARWGFKSERAFRKALKGLLEESFPVKVERYTAIDTEGEVFEGNPGEVVELDLIIKDGELIVAELKSFVSVGDVLHFIKKVKFFEKKEGKRATKKVIISPMIEPKAEVLIEKLGLIVYTDIPDDEQEFLSN